MDPVEWSKEVEIYTSQKSDVERKAVNNIFNAAIKKDDTYLYQVLNKFNLNKSLYVFAWVSQFVSNCHIKDN